MNTRIIRAFAYMAGVIFLVSACRNGTKTNPNTDAELLEFHISELPNTTFTIDQEQNLIEVSNPSSLNSNDFSSLTASFSASENATVLVEGVEQIPGETVNSFSNGVFYTVVSEDEQSQETYFAYLTKDLPLAYLLDEEPTIELNTSGISPLTANIHFETRSTAQASIEILGDISVQHSFPTVSQVHNLPVFGLYPATENRVVLTVENNHEQTVNDTLIIETEALHDFLPTPQIDVLKESQMEPGMHFNHFLIGNNGNYNSYPLIFDNNGDIRWILDLSEFNKAVWGVSFDEGYSLFFATGNAIYEYDMQGHTLNTISIGDHISHHEVLKLPDGNYLVAVNRNGSTMIKEGEEIDSVEDFIIEVTPSGNITSEWDMAEILDVNRTTLTDGGSDWFHMNAIWHNEADNSLIISGRNQGLVKVSEENELQWVLAPHKGWGKAGRYEKTTETAPYLLTAVDGNLKPFSDDIQQGTLESNSFSWTWGQHAPLILPNGNLFVFDNGFNRNFGAAASYSMGTEYKIDEEEMTVQQVWSYGKERGSELFSNIISDVDYLPETGNRLFMPGIIRPNGEPQSKIVEVSYPDKEVVFESTLYFKNQLVNGQGWGNLDITYRAGRVSLYPK